MEHLYQVLRHRGVKFRFFNAARRLVPDKSGTRISALDMVEQAVVTAGAYKPLIDVRGLPCWPSEPDWTQLQDGERLRNEGIDFECEKEPPQGRAYRLEQGRDFDVVILGASLGSVPYLAKDLIAASPRWQKMVEKVGTVATQAAQFWLNKTADEFGWTRLVADHNPGDQSGLQTVMTSFSEPLDTWADMSDLLEREDWPEPGPRSIAYFCSPCLDEAEDPDRWQDQVRAWAGANLVRLWPKAEKDGAFDPESLYRTGGGTGEERFKAQYFRQNRYGSERYVLSVPGSVQFRLSADDSGFANLYLAGDWTRCGMNAGCVEAATISGLIAARSLTGAKMNIVGESDFAADADPATAGRLASPYAQTAPWPLTPFFGTGQMDGFFSFHAVDTAALQKVLPRGMHLLPQALTPPGLHPVSILANRQMGVRPAVMPRLLGFPWYLEAIIAINWVGLEGQRGAFTYLPNLYLDARLPQLAGLCLYGYNKRLGQLEMGENAYRVKDSAGAPVWSARYQQQGFCGPLVEFAEAASVQALSEQILVSSGKFGGWQFSSFDFNFTSAIVAPVSAEITVENGALAGLPAGLMEARPLGSAAPAGNQLPGALRIWTSWTLTNPLDSDRLRRIEKSR
jgi:hypothetical protein